MATATGNGAQVTVTVTPTVTATADSNVPDETTSSTLSLIYIYSASTVAEPTSAAASTESTDDSRRISGGAIAGIVVGSVAFLVILALALFCYSRHVARKRRAEFACLHSSRHTAPSQAYSHAATTVQGTDAASDGQYARSLGQHSSATAMRSILTKSPDGLLPTKPPQALPTLHNRSELEAPVGARVVRHPTKKRPDVGEVYGSHTYPAELPTGSQADLVTVIREVKPAKVSCSARRGRQEREPDGGGSEGYMTPDSRSRWRPGPGSSSEKGVTSDYATTDAGETEYGDTAAEERSIHIYFRPGSGWDTSLSPLSSRQSQIAAAMSQASSTGKLSRSTVRSSTTATK